MAPFLSPLVARDRQRVSQPPSADAIKKRYQRFCTEYGVEVNDEEVRLGTFVKEAYAYGAS